MLRGLLTRKFAEFLLILQFFSRLSSASHIADDLSSSVSPSGAYPRSRRVGKTLGSVTVGPKEGRFVLAVEDKSEAHVNVLIGGLGVMGWRR